MPETLDAETIAAEKKKMRRRIGTVCRGLDVDEVRAQSDRIARALFDGPTFGPSHSPGPFLGKHIRGVSVYLNLPQGEVMTSNIIDRLFDVGKDVYIPKVDGPGPEDMRMLHVPSKEMFSRFKRNRWQIPEPSDEDAMQMTDALSTGDVDLVLVPGVAFDSAGRRLGHGGGYYDSFIRRLTDVRRRDKRPSPMTMGLALSMQMVPNVPVQSDGTFPDLQLDAVTTPDRTHTTY